MTFPNPKLRTRDSDERGKEEKNTKKIRSYNTKNPKPQTEPVTLAQIETPKPLARIETPTRNPNPNANPEPSVATIPYGIV